MAKILKKEQLSDSVWRFRLNAPRIARKRKAGQFIILRPVSDSERIPLTIANVDAGEGWIELIFQVIGRTTMQMRGLNVGDSVADLAGPLGNPTHIENFGRALCIGGGVGAAPLYPIIKAMFEAGNDVTAIIGARNKELILLEDEIRASSRRLLIATDDGSYGAKGFVSDVFNGLIGSGEKFDAAVVIGPAMMMRATCRLTVAAGIKTYASLNPIMIDGTGMCGCCRVTVGGETRFACVDGPEFDASLIEWDELIARMGSYKDFEKKAIEDYHTCRLEGAA
ncbi:MAG: sulfide/dihydroorotate dehydrogenase-like FAD/NAD-binding protein [Chitinispirillia bacterium]|nr:sulfide/dihydroorotate dehydrogenase-like FAD/NAD-binding protein [Chitinispirillia bacterium]MCL2268690.1 sulfide/dihydroorotate dehydrogenase-like FAD/NAD-binding protein [Chitinispirillia bacterium]